MGVIMTKIMLVEDDKSLREVYGVRLAAEGYQIISAGDGEEALAMAVKEKPEIILSDVMMPKISGFDMLDILRATPETKNIKVIMMTALSSEDQRERGESLGADRYLVKSQVGIEDVVRTVHEILDDAPVSATPAAQFGAPVPTAAVPASQPELVSPAPTPTMPNIEPVAPISTQEPQPAESNPINPVAAPAPVPVTPEVSTYAPDPVGIPAPQVIETPVPAPTQPAAVPAPAPIAPAPAPQPAPLTPSTAPMAPIQPQSTSTLPQPTAPFSTPAPASLADKVINPITPTEPAKDINAMMSQELNGTAPFIQADQRPMATPPTPTPNISAEMAQGLHDGSETAPINPPQF